MNEMVLQIVVGIIQVGAVFVAYGKLKQKVDDIDSRVRRIESWIDHTQR